MPGLPKSFPLGRVGGGAPKDLWIPCPADEPLKITEVQTMEKIKSFRKGRLWLNVYLADDGELALTIIEELPVQGWRLEAQRIPQDAASTTCRDLVQLLAEFLEYDQAAKVGGVDRMSPSTPSFRGPPHRGIHQGNYGFWLETDEVEELGALAVHAQALRHPHGSEPGRTGHDHGRASQPG